MRWLTVAVMFILTSCAAMTQVGPGETLVRERLSVVLDQGWNRLAIGSGTETWTLEGLPLDTLRFYVDVKDGEPLETVRGVNKKELPQFRSAMEPAEVVEMFEMTSVADGSRFRLLKLAPAEFLGGTGFRFDYALVRKSNEVDFRGFAYGAIREGHLTLIVFEAPKTYYFGRLAARAEAVAVKARLVR